MYADMMREITRKQLHSARKHPTTGPDLGMPRVSDPDGRLRGLLLRRPESLNQEQTGRGRLQPLALASERRTSSVALGDTSSQLDPQQVRNHGPHDPPPVPSAGRPVVAYLRDQARQMLAYASPPPISPQLTVARQATTNHRLLKEGKHHFDNLQDPLASIYDDIWAVIQEAMVSDLPSSQPSTNHLGNLPLNPTPRYPDASVIPVFFLDPVSNHSLTFIDDDGNDPVFVGAPDEITSEMQRRADQLGKRRCGRCWRWRFEDKYVGVGAGVCVFCLRNGEAPGWVLAASERTGDVCGAVG